MTGQDAQIATILSIPFEENSYVVHLPARDDCLVVDPGLEPRKILDYLGQKNLTPAAILNTHGHSDHIAGNTDLKIRWPNCPLVIGAAEASKLTDPRLNLSAFFGERIVSPPADVLVRDGDIYSAAGFDLLVRSIAGHSVGHVVYIWSSHQPPWVFVGDVIFAGSVGRTDFPDGDFTRLEAGIRDVLYSMPAETLLLPGHGPPTTVEREKQSNPFVAER